MADIKLPQRSESAVKLHGKRGKQLSPEAMSFYTEEALRARDIEVAKVVLEAAAKVLSEHQIPVGNSAAGEMACEWTYDALKDCRDVIRNLEIGHD